MNPQELNALHIVHVASVLILLCFTFYAFAAAPETRKAVLSITGLAALVVIATGVRMWQGLYGFAPLVWIFVKIVCLLGIAGLVGLAYRRRDLRTALMIVVLALAITAVAMVYLKPSF
jgi:ABC-type transport system involved in cytochrome c biogenesis permease subunit